MIRRRSIIATLQLRVVSHNGSVNLQTKPSSCFIINPQFQRTDSLRKWIIDDAPTVDNIFNTKNYTTSAIPLQLPIPDHIVLVKNIKNIMTTRPTFWIKGKIQVTNFGKPFWYPACDKCHRTTGTPIGTTFECPLCDTLEAKAIHWYHTFP